MTETALPPAETAPLDPIQLLLPSLTAMVADLAQMLPPASVVHALQAKQLLQQMGHAAQVLQLRSLQSLMQAMQTPLDQYAQSCQVPADKTGELLQLAVRDMQAFLRTLENGGKPVAQDLFASYRSLHKLSGKDTAHPAQLWDKAWQVPVLPLPKNTAPTAPDAEVRTQLDQHILALLRTHNPMFCAPLQTLCLGLAAHAQDHTPWQLAAAWLEGLEYGLLEIDIYAKRMASRLLAFYTSYAKGEQAPPAGLLHELLFFCAQACTNAQERRQAIPPLLQLVRTQCTLTDQAPAASSETEAEADSQSEANEPALKPALEDSLSAQDVDAASVTSPSSTAAAVPRPALAPALPEFEQAPEILPAAPLVQGLATTQQIEPDLEFLLSAQSLSDQLEAEIAAWQQDDSTALQASTPEHAGELSRLAWAAGCAEIASLAHMLQRCLQRMHTSTTTEQRKVCQYASEEIRRLLHQFAAGFLRRTHPQVMEALHRLFAQLPEPVLNFALSTSTADAPPKAPPLAPAEMDKANAAVISAASVEAVESADTVVQPAAAVDTDVACAGAGAPAALDAMHFSVFEEEMLAVWPQLQGALKQWMQQPASAPARQTVLRHLHTLKGSARMAGAMVWASQVHALEGLALDVQPQSGPLGPSALQQPLETLRLAFVALQKEMAERYPEHHSTRLGSDPLHTVARHTQALWGTQDAGQRALQDSHLSLQEISTCLQKLRMQIKDCAAWADTLMLHGDTDLPYEWHEELHDLVRALNDCTDDLGTSHQQLQHSMADASQALQAHSGHLRALQHTLLYAQLRPLSHMQERLTHCAELAQHDTGKRVELLWQGAETTMQREVLEALTPALEHLLRNSIAHGIEDTVVRQAAQKPAQGKILIRLHSAGTQQVLTLMDDGAGLDLAAIRDKALALGLISEQETIDNARAAQLIQHPGLSTASTVTELAGRGIGMDVVADTIAALGGKLHITSTAGKGCRFDIVLPAPPYVEQVLALRAGSWRVAVLARTLEAVRRIPADVADQALAQGVLQDDASGPLPLYWAGAAWQQSRRSLEPPIDGMRQLLIVRSDTSRWGLIVDEVLGTQEVTLQSTADLEVPIPGLLGTAAQPSGSILQVYDAAAVLSAHESRLLLHQDKLSPAPASDEPTVRPLVMLADDSMSVRRLAQHLLQNQGYRVMTAADGLEALHMLEASVEVPAVLIADIEMPDMDGMELLRRVRADARLKQLPVVMLTAHSAGPVSQKAIDMGAQAFLTKPYSPNELVAQVRRYGHNQQNQQNLPS